MHAMDGVMRYVIWGLTFLIAVNFSFLVGFCLASCFAMRKDADRLAQLNTNLTNETFAFRPSESSDLAAGRS